MIAVNRTPGAFASRKPEREVKIEIGSVYLNPEFVSVKNMGEHVRGASRGGPR